MRQSRMVERNLAHIVPRSQIRLSPLKTALDCRALSRNCRALAVAVDDAHAKITGSIEAPPLSERAHALQSLEQLVPARRPDSYRRGRDDSALESKIAAAVTLDRSAARKLQRSLAPALNVGTELLVPGLVEPELVAAEPAERAEHLGKDHRAEAAILLACEPAETLETVAGLHFHQVDEVPGLGASKEGEHLVDGELLAREHGSWLAALGWKEPRVRRQIELRPIVGALDDQSCKSRVDLDAVDGEAGCAESSVDGGDKPVNGLRSEAEEVQVAGLSLNVAAGDEGGAAGKREFARLLEAGDDPRDLLLERCQHLRGAAVTLEPVGPCSAHGRRQNELLEELA